MSKQVRVIKRFLWFPTKIGPYILWLRTVNVHQVWDVRTVFAPSEGGSPIGAIHKAEGWFDVVITTTSKLKSIL